MHYLFGNPAGISLEDANAVLIIGIIIVAGALAGRLFQLFRIPQIIGFVVIGVLVGPVLGILTRDAIAGLELFNRFALGVIGFMVGGELKREIFVRYGRQVMWILTLEALTAFLLVGLLTFSVMLIFATWQNALAVGIVFAAICAATDPASTTSVLWEYKTRGPLTTMLTAIVALDDALALLLYAVGVTVAATIVGGGEDGFLTALGHSSLHLALSLAAGSLLGVLLSWAAKTLRDDAMVLMLTLSGILLGTGVAIHFKLDIILVTMAMGTVLVNIRPRRSGAHFGIIHKMSPPIYAVFFVLVGANLDFGAINLMVILLMFAYVLGSVVGKTSGAFLGGMLSKASFSVRNYLGFCLYPQGGIAVALLMLARERFADPALADSMVLVVLTGALVLQLIGPFGIKFAAARAGEIGLNITEDDLIGSYTVADVIHPERPSVLSSQGLDSILRLFSRSDYNAFGVVDEDGKVIGLITLDGIRNTFAASEVNEWLIALDVMEPVSEWTTTRMPLADALEMAHKLDVDYLLVADDNAVYAGLLEIRSLHRTLATEVLERQKRADKMHGLGAS